MSQKIYPLRFSTNISLATLHEILHAYYTFIHTQNWEILFSYLYLTKLRHVKCNHLVNFYISLEKKQS